MTILKDRFWKITIGESEKTGKVITDLRVKFKVKKTGDMNPNECSLEIYNLNPENREFIKKYMVLCIEAGYKELNGQIFKGEISLINAGVKESTDRITKIEAKDSFKKLRDVYLSKSFTAKTRESDVIKYVTDKLGLTMGSTKGLHLAKKFYNKGISLSGNIKHVLESHLSPLGLKYVINDGVFNIVEKNIQINDKPILLDFESGLIGSPEKTEKGYKFKSLMRCDINLGSTIELKSQKVNGLFIVQNLEHDGDSSGTNDSWITECEVQAV